ncbi:MAG: chorismate-binding protein [Microbacteriaceae bacterium]
MHPLLDTLLADSARAGAPERPFALLAREGTGTLEVLLGDIVDVPLLADIPLVDASGAPQQVLALVPFRQVRERGYECNDDGEPLRCLIVREREEVPLAEAMALLPQTEIALHDGHFDVSDDAYAKTVREVIEHEIGRGEGANFVIRRDFTARIDADPRTAALSWLHALLTHERGAYWTFAIVTDGLVTVGASPEAHVRVDGGTVIMNPISGTFRHPAEGPTVAAMREFLTDTKETEELFMVVDEELKMMSAICAQGGRITGPHLKQMSRLTHTEYVLSGHSDLDPREILRETMFAPTVTGSPMQNACAVIRRHETTPRGYYSGVVALFTPSTERAGTHDLDAPILIRTAYLRDGVLRVPVGATLVRHSTPEGEVSETHGKAAGVLGAIGAVPRGAVADADVPRLADDPELRALLESRNERLAPFWLRPQIALHEADDTNFTGRTAIVVDAEDRFTTMLAHQLRHLGLHVEVVPWQEADPAALAAADLVVAGPGPGDPRDAESPRIARMREVITTRLAQQRPLLAVCLSHQILSDVLGLDLAPLATPHQGLQRTVELFGAPATIGFYNTFTAKVLPGVDALVTDDGEIIEIAADEDGTVQGIRGLNLASVQGHLESILSSDGVETLERLIEYALHR